MHDLVSSASCARFVLASLAGWRISHLLAREDGPGALMARLRRQLARFNAGGWLDCFGCVSLWAAAPVSLWVTGLGPAWGMIWLATAGAILLLDRLGSEPVVLRPLDEEANHGML
jgi:hypothetical protein